jgi:hypothetical protein
MNEEKNKKTNVLSHLCSGEGGKHCTKRMLILVIILFIVGGIALWFFSHYTPPVEELPIDEDTTMTQENLERIMNTPLPPEEIVEYNEEELIEFMNTPLPPEEITEYNEEELEMMMNSTE